ncbi:MAG TPA: ABC transporter permease subunit [Candidatus Binatia bacterium]|nr:ABC transporter permease subunit [Candidatus Binatia bacterium]
MIRAAAWLEVRRNRSLVLWLGVVTFVYAGTMAAFYPIMRDNAAALEQYLELFPEAFLAAFGISGSLGKPGVFFTTYLGSYLWPIVAAIAAIAGGTRVVAADLERGFLDVVIATPISRRRYLLVSIVGQAVVQLLLALALVAGVLVVGVLVGAGFEPGPFLLVVVPATLFGWAIAGLATVLAVATLSRGIAAGVTTAVLLVMYLIFVVAQIEPDLEELKAFSLFGHFDTTAVIDEGVLQPLDLAVHAGVGLLGWGAALWRFRERDLAA